MSSNVNQDYLGLSSVLYPQWQIRFWPKCMRILK